MRRLETAHLLLQRITDDSVRTEKQRDSLIAKMIDMGVLQLIYKNCHREQKEEL